MWHRRQTQIGAPRRRLLWISPGTVRRHLENVYRKLGVDTRTAAVARLNSLAAGSDP